MACAKQVFDNVTGAVWDCLVAKLKADYGIDITSDVGHTSKLGFHIEWDFHRADQILSITCTVKPFLVTCGEVNGKIHSTVDSCM